MPNHASNEHLPAKRQYPVHVARRVGRGLMIAAIVSASPRVLSTAASGSSLIDGMNGSALTRMVLEREAAYQLAQSRGNDPGSSRPQGRGKQKGDSASGRDETPTFDFTVPEFRLRYNAQLAKDGDQRVKGCSVRGDIHECEFDDEVFQKGVAAFKALNLVNGRFQQKARLGFVTENGKVSKIVLAGDRADPMNAFGYIGLAGNLINTFEPTLKNEELHNFTYEKLLLGQGDSQPNIASPRLEIRPNFLITCLQAMSRVNTAIVCMFEPRS